MNPKRSINPSIVIAEALIVTAAIIGLFLVYHTQVTGWETRSAQQDAQQQLTQQWQQPAQTNGNEVRPADNNPIEGDAVGLIRIPKLGDSWQYAFFKGTDQQTLAKGPGMYPYETDTADKTVKNLGLAAHRDGWDAPFSDLDKLEPCDEINIEYRTKTVHYRVLPTETDPQKRDAQLDQYTCFNDSPTAYRNIMKNAPYSTLSGQYVTDPTDVNVVKPLPGNPDTKAEPDELPGLNLLTLTTCHPHWENRQRLIIHAVAVDQTYKEN